MSLWIRIISTDRIGAVVLSTPVIRVLQPLISREGHGTLDVATNVATRR